MPEIRRIGEVKHRYAYTEFGDIFDVKKDNSIVNGKKIKLFLFENQSIEVTPKQGQKNTWHLAIKPNSFIRIGNDNYQYSRFSESPEHLDFKFQIAKNGFFYWNDYKVSIYNCRIEAKIYGSMFRADCTGQLSDGTRIFIEVVKTSEISKKKKEYLNQNDLLTFEIRIDNDGNQDHERFDLYGNSEIESIEREIQELQSRIPKCERESARVRYTYDYEKERVGKELSKLERQFSDRIAREREFAEYKYEPDSYELRKEIEKRRDKSFEFIERIRDITKDIRSIEKSFGFIEKQIRDNEIGEDKKQANRRLLKETRGF